ncbi:hypothetical protein K4F52_002897 [Lecanicillium sp. MT-2017a]|nr:hypothetical protein K4F52_002897 [Lecanicillium sp. MT-2017a]
MLDIVYDGLQDRQPWRQANYRARGHSLSRDVLPPDWEFIEGFRYFVDIVVAAHNESKLADSDYDAQHAATAQVTAKDSFLMTIFAHRISALARSQHSLPRPNEPASVSHLWARFYHYMMLAIQDINRHINGGSPPKAALYRIVDIMGVELRVMSPMWRAHIEGFGALVRKYGGVRKVLGPHDGASPVLALQVILIYTVMANAVSPIENQISACSDWSTEELYDVYSSNLYSDMPCPTDLFVDIIRITRLRLLYAAGASVSKVILPVAREIFRDIQSFLPDDWNESYPLPKSRKHALIGRIFKSAVALYCLLSMPEMATVFPSDSQNSDSVPEPDPIQVCRRNLMESITVAMKDLPSKVPLS